MRVTGRAEKYPHFSRPFSSINIRKDQRTGISMEYASAMSTLSPRVSIPVNGEVVEFSPVLLRDACACPACVHEFTRQRLFSAADIPADIEAREVEVDALSDSVKITWNNDLSGYGKEHATTLKLTALQDMIQSGCTPGSHRDTFPPNVLWNGCESLISGWVLATACC